MVGRGWRGRREFRGFVGFCSGLSLVFRYFVAVLLAVRFVRWLGSCCDCSACSQQLEIKRLEIG